MDFENNISSENMVAEMKQITEETDKCMVSDNGPNIPSQTKESEENTNKDNISKDDNVVVGKTPSCWTSTLKCIISIT